jgi:hypothetical protein
VPGRLQRLSSALFRRATSASGALSQDGVDRRRLEGQPLLLKGTSGSTDSRVVGRADGDGAAALR